jgi:hypothetical protein
MLGDISLAQEQFDRAARRYEERLAFEGSQGVWGPIDAQAGLAAVNFCTGNYVESAMLYRDGLDQAKDLGISLLMASTLLGLAGVAATSGRPEVGARLLGAADAIVASLGAPIFPRDQPVRDRCLSALTAALGEERLAVAREAGRMLAVEHAIALAQDMADTCINHKILDRTT